MKILKAESKLKGKNNFQVSLLSYLLKYQRFKMVMIYYQKVVHVQSYMISKYEITILFFWDLVLVCSKGYVCTGSSLVFFPCMRDGVTNKHHWIQFRIVFSFSINPIFILKIKPRMNFNVILLQDNFLKSILIDFKIFLNTPLIWMESIIGIIIFKMEHW